MDSYPENILSVTLKYSNEMDIIHIPIGEGIDFIQNSIKL